MSNALLELRGCSLSVSGRLLLADLSLRIFSGEKVAIVGANGAGKSSLLKTIAGLYRGYTGSVTVEGEEIKKTAPKQLARLVSLVPQRLEFVPRFTVQEFLELSGVVGVSALDVTISQLLNRHLPDLSGGELQRVILAGAVAQGARLLLLDEPTAHLDPTGRNQVERVIAQYHEEKNISYLLVTHDIALAMRAAERVLVMKGGRVVWDGSTADATLLEVLGDAYDCPFSTFVQSSTGKSIILAG